MLASRFLLAFAPPFSQTRSVTRACELLVLPRLDVAARGSAWNTLLDLSIDQLPKLDLSNLSPGIGPGTARAENTQTRDIFAAEAAAIAARQRRIVWRAPSREESVSGPALEAEPPEILVTDANGNPVEGSIPLPIQGGRERGSILHKLIEEVLTGETPEAMPDLIARAETLIRAIGLPVASDPAQGLAPAEIADCAARALSNPEIAGLRPGLLPEFPVYASTTIDAEEEATAGIVDAIAFGPNGAPQVVVDWKSDVAPSHDTLEHYRAQVGAYLDMTGAERGLIVLATTAVQTAAIRSIAVCRRGAASSRTRRL